MLIRRATLFLLALVLLLSGCSKPLPYARADYVGHWQGPNMELLITADGKLSYRHFVKSKKTSIDAPIIEFKGNDFVVGVWFLTTTFVVSEPPHEINGKWQMVVDGIRLTRTAPGTPVPLKSRPKFSCLDCSLSRVA